MACHLYADGELVLTLDPEPEEGREVTLSSRMCATARYRAIGSRAWDDAGVDVLKATFSEDLSGLTYANLSYWFYYTDGEMTEVVGLSNLPEVREMRYAFSNCDGLTELDLSGFPTEGAHGPVLLLLGLLEPGDNLGGCGLVAARGVRGVRHVLRLRAAGGRRGDDVRRRRPGRGLLPDRRPRRWLRGI